MKKTLTYVTVLVAAILAAGRSARAEVKVALIQYQVRDDHAVGVDGDQVETYVREAAAAGAGMIVAPETCFYRYKPWLEAGVTIADLAAQYDALTARFSALADELDICLVMGLREPYTDTHVYNTAVFFGPDGALLGDYHKVLPSSSELAWTQPGNAQLGFPTPYGRCGMLICKDLRVESIVARYDTQAIDLLVVVAADNDGSTFPYLAPVPGASLRARGLSRGSVQPGCEPWGRERELGRRVPRRQCLLFWRRRGCLLRHATAGHGRLAAGRSAGSSPAERTTASLHHGRVRVATRRACGGPRAVGGEG